MSYFKLIFRSITCTGRCDFCVNVKGKIDGINDGKNLNISYVCQNRKSLTLLHLNYEGELSRLRLEFRNYFHFSKFIIHRTIWHWNSGWKCVFKRFQLWTICMEKKSNHDLRLYFLFSGFFASDSTVFFLILQFHYATENFKMWS